MYLLIGQIVYSSFARIGFKTLASAQIPTEIQQAFMQGVVSQYWDSYNPPRSEYRAVYIHQVTPEHNLFGWLYNDGADDMGRSNVPYFICYYLAEPLLDFQLENIFTCLQKGPLALIDRSSLPDALETIVIQTPWTFNDDFWSYQPARAGVEIPLVVRDQSHVALRQGKLLDLFVPVEQEEMVIDLVDEQAITPYQEYKEKLQLYDQVLVEAIQHQDRNAQPIKISQPPEKFAEAIKSKDVTQLPLKAAVAFHKADTRSRRGTVLPQIFAILQNFNIGLENSTDHNFLLAYRNTQFLLGVGIAATSLALIGSIYGLLQISIFDSSKPELMPSASSSVFYKTLTKVSNVIQG